MERAVFLDKDGTLMQDVPYNVDPRHIIFMPDIVSLRTVQQMGYKLIIISNQSGVARGFFKEASLQQVEEAIRTHFAQSSISLDGFYYCPHHPEGSVPALSIPCDCRKPNAGMLLKAASDHNLDLSASWMIGDILHDTEAGKRAGTKTILLDTGNETEWVKGENRTPDYLAGSLSEAVSLIELEEKKYLLQQL